jgi:hypothetical protein
VCGLGDIKPEKFGQFDAVVTQASRFGEGKEVYDGVDATSGRFGEQGLFSGGMNVGRTWTQCVQVDQPIQFCKNVPPFFNPEFKFSVSYRLPWDVQASAVFQSVPGIPINADYVATNAEIAPSLGRNLAACGNQVPCTAIFLVTLKEPNQDFEDRRKQLDVRFAKNVRLGRTRIRGMFDIYNIFNGSNACVSPILRLPVRSHGNVRFSAVDGKTSRPSDDADDVIGRREGHEVPDATRVRGSQWP